MGDAHVANSLELLVENWRLNTDISTISECVQDIRVHVLFPFHWFEEWTRKNPSRDHVCILF